MTALERTLRLTAEVLDGLEVPWALVGGLAVSARTEPRFTRDIDLAVSVADDPTAEAVVRSFLDHGFQVASLVEQDVLERLATVRLRPPTTSDTALLVDLLFASSGIEAEIGADADRIEIFPGLPVAVASAAHLLALKVLARDDRARPQDAADIRALVPVIDPCGIARAREASRLIMDRGFNRERDLEADLETCLQQMSEP